MICQIIDGLYSIYTNTSITISDTAVCNMEIQLPSDTRYELLAKMCYRGVNTLAVVYLTNMGNFAASNKRHSV